jgi:hypothetical protein
VLCCCLVDGWWFHYLCTKLIQALLLEYFRLLVREKAKIHRSHERVINGFVVGIIIIHNVVQFYCSTTTWLLCMHGYVHDKQPEIHCSDEYVYWICPRRLTQRDLLEEAPYLYHVSIPFTVLT